MAKASKTAKSEKVSPKSEKVSPKRDAGATVPADVNDVKNEREKKIQTFVVRTIWTFVMIFVFFFIVLMGHLWTIALVVVVQVLTFKECITIASEPAREKDLPYTRALAWYFLAATVYYLEGESLIFYFKHVIFVDTLLQPLANNHRFISYCLYITGFVFFVSTLKKGHYKFQFAQLCITHMTLLLVVFQGNLIINNILTGMFWFFLPVGLVITNDIFAYLCGITFGKTQLIAISPKKTVEGFIGAWICTALMAIFLSNVLSQLDYLVCPATDLGTSFFTTTTCVPNPVFFEQKYCVPEYLVELLGVGYVTFKPIYFHAMVLATFASLIAPFGGFFCSGLKRAFAVKDFGDTIPGHGGITDRMDCQYLMGSFSYLYFQTFISTQNVTIGTVLQMAVINLDGPQLLQLIAAILRYLNNIGMISKEQLVKITEILA
ncbi:hypothetical protein BABINDRAFT_42133 [Babjeviella inositovora NRRL Y-12698]|uniref:Phosphatidate cytidylyltransferase n=1 Tax=Babjeviella inositovora NRRL Y-12698 TaxID=984486 RepID=A0A1E3QJD2_9ASCO|nr:uncharacterized protein BABINDRAFT_42133 [Babjeviella inositovora NRRL Y-12698]ODQ77182.1 hypothetical protein BABINDRAFT_42133 [Babjeviella inositovora NRRL Y-12698]